MSVVARARNGEKLFEVPDEQMQEMLDNGWVEYEESLNRYEITPKGYEHLRQVQRH